jgi:trehalose-phosphatase
LPSALEEIGQVLFQLTTDRAAQPPFLFFDYDGTLTPIVSDPDKARLPNGTREVLLRLAQQTHVGILTGRDLEEIRKQVAIESITYAGSYGFEYCGPGGLRWSHHDAEGALASLDQIESSLRQELKPIEGVRLERKRFSLAVHFLAVPAEAVKAVDPIVAHSVSLYPDLRVLPGKKVLELLPNLPWDKGNALRALQEQLRSSGSKAQSCYLGDDLTDEPAFKVVAEQDGLGIRVGGDSEQRPTAAHFSLQDPDEVREFLEKLSEMLP